MKQPSPARCIRGVVRLGLALISLAGCAPPAEPLRLVLLVTVDTLRADHLGAYGSERGLTPNLDRLAERALVFSSAYAAAPLTLPSVASLMTGRHPVELGIWSNESLLQTTAPTLAAALGERGWSTAAVIGNWILRRACGLGAGFESYDDSLPQREAIRRWPERVAADLTDSLLEILARCTEAADARCFLWGHYQDPHGPYTPPAQLRERYLEDERRRPGGTDRLPVLDDHRGIGGIPDYQLLEGKREVAFYRAGYAGEIRYLDREIGRLLDALEARGLMEQTVIVFAADHGESLGENDQWFAHGEYLTEPLVRVPLMIRAPGLPAGRRDDLASLLDVHATLLELATGVPPDPKGRGRNLLALDAAQRESVSYLTTLGGGARQRRGLVQGAFKYTIEKRDGVWYGRLVRREREDLDLIAAAPQVAAKMRRRLEYLLGDLQRDAAPVQRQELSERDRARLRALGYVEGD
jgi:arylsulfatase